MQTLAKCSSRHFAQPRGLFGSAFQYSVENKTFNKEEVCKLWNNFRNCRSFHSVSKKTLRHLKKEYQAVRSLLLRSGIDEISLQQIIRSSRSLSTSSTRFNNAPQSGKEPPANPSSDPNKEGSGNSGNKDPGKEPSDKDKVTFVLKCVLIIFLQIITAMFLLGFKFESEPTEVQAQVSWNDFVYHMLAKGEVERVIIEPELEMADIIVHRRAIIKGKRVVNRVFRMRINNPDRFEEKLRAVEASLGIRPEDGIPVSYDRKFALYSRLLSAAVFLGLTYWLFKGRKGGASFPMDFLSQMKRAKFTLIDPLTGSGKGVRFRDVAGLQEAKVEVMELVDYLKRPEHYKTLGAKVPRGALLLGPPGCGKTMLAKAISTEANVPFLSMNGSEFIEMVGGLGAARVRNLFEEAKKRAPSIIYIDEIDSMGAKRQGGAQAGGGNRESEQTLNQLLVEMDGLVSRGDVIVIASTNRAEVLDNALLRPGRFDRHILIDLPTLEERRQIFEQHLKSIKLEKSPSAYSMRLAHLTPGFSGADIANVCNEAALCAARQKKKQVDGTDLAHAIDRVIGGVEKKNHAMAPSEKKVVAYHESGHALVAWLLEHTDALLKVTIVPRTSMALGFAQYVPTDQKLYTKEQLMERMCMMLGGRVAESLTFNKITTGAQDDLNKVTKMAYALVQQYGMSSTVGLISFDPEQTSGQTKKPYSKKLGNVMDAAASRLIVESYKRVEKLLLANNDKLQLIAEELLKRETLSYEDVEKLIGPPPFGKKQLVDPSDLDTLIEPMKPPEPEVPSPEPHPA
ncbi:paraplegin [Belonocnema kinseyi]|uniref:paraplegin n=1 Tax=Belonocnema kinseyi TaxID=2817044 RepID=UPI00143D3CD6|nr:paraplegin [Belonocnema kinseyi]